MASSKIAWGMEIGANEIKAVRLERNGDEVTVSDFAVIAHKRVLSTPDVDQNELIRLSLGEFISQKSIEGERLVMSVPGQAAFARFAKLPPVEPRKVPDIVKFEAVQQIPFPIDQVEWDYQTFASEDSPEVEVGIFAITRERLQQRLDLYAELGVQPEVVTLSPVAVFNALTYDLGASKSKGPLVFLDIGTTASDLIVADEGRCWIRTFPLGGTHFTEAVMSAFKLSYTKADKLKQESATSKYAKQIMQAMRPVFSDLLQEIQRSLGYYQGLHRESKLATIIGLGSTFKIPGLRKFLGQQLQMEVLRLDEFKRIRVEGREAAEFAAHTVNLATAYGLALQGVGLAPISVNLAPVAALREQLWRAKTKWFAATAAVVAIAGGLMFARGLLDRQSMRTGGVDPVVDQAISRGTTFRNNYQALQSSSVIGYQAENVRRLLEEREVWPYIISDAVAALQSASPQPTLTGDDPEAVLRVPADQRRLITLTSLKGQYNRNADNRRRIDVMLGVEFTHADRERFLNDTVAKWLRDNRVREGVPYEIVEESVSLNTPLLVTETVSEGGKRVASAGSGGAPGSTGATGTPGGFGTPPAAPRPTPPPAQGGGGEGGGGSGAMPGRRGLSAPVTAPGAGSEGGFPGQPGLTAPSSPETPGLGAAPPLAPGPQGSAPGREGPTDLAKLAPIPDRPQVFKPGDKVHRGVITFTIELKPTDSGAAPIEENPV